MGRPTLLLLLEEGSSLSFHKTKSVGHEGHHTESLINIKVIIWDDAKQKVAIQLPVLTTVRGVRLSRSHIVVALQNSIRVYKFQSPPELWAVFETADNPLGLCCLTSKTLAFPGRTPGQVQMVELAIGNVSIIPAHGSSLRAIDISRDGEVLATASETVIASFPSRSISLANPRFRAHWCVYLQPATAPELLNLDVVLIMQPSIPWPSLRPDNC